MEFINFDARIDDDNISDVYDAHFSVDKNNDFIDDWDEISENVCKYCRFDRVTRSAEDALKDAFIENGKDLENSNDVTNFVTILMRKHLKLMILIGRVEKWTSLKNLYLFLMSKGLLTHFFTWYVMLSLSEVQKN